MQRGADQGGYRVDLTLSIEDRKGLLAEISAKIAEVNTTSNGVFGVKMHWNQYKRHMLDLGVDVSLWGAPVSWLRITRENELRQAISFVRAAQTESWNSNMEVTREPRYDAQAIVAALDRIASENADWDRYFAEQNRYTGTRATIDPCAGR